MPGGERDLGEAISGIDGDQPRRHVLHRRRRLPVDPAGLEACDIAGQAQQPMALGAVALRRDNPRGDDAGIAR